MNDVRIIVGPTACGKTKRAVELAKAIGGEIINCDSLQIYNDLKILTAFPSDEDMDGIKHKLFGYLDYDQKTSAVEWAKRAAVEIRKTLDMGKVPIIVGGTGMYLKTLIEGISPMPDISEQNRKKANDLASQNFDSLCYELYAFDPELRRLLPKSKHHQLVRAYEVFLETGKSIRYFQGLPKLNFIENINFEFEIINIERSELYERISRRFDQMLKDGAIEEVNQLLKKINNPNRTEIFKNYPIFKAIGAKEITMFIDGIYSFEQMREVSITNSKHYAKRQITWFKHQIDI